VQASDKPEFVANIISGSFHPCKIKKMPLNQSSSWEIGREKPLTIMEIFKTCKL
jgi:hypothetical protein